MILYAFLGPMTGPLEEGPSLGLSVLPILFLVGFATTCLAARAGREREKTWLLLCWFLVPLAVLSSQEVKFDRYLFIWSMPLCAFFVALGVRQVLRLRPLRDAQFLAAVCLALLVVVAPQLVGGAEGTGWRVRSASWTFLQNRLVHAPHDNWERVRWQADFLREHMRPGDVVVSTLDDASLAYYLGQFVYGFLNSAHTDAFFVDLLDRAERTGTQVWLMDTLPKWNFCLAGEPEPWRIDCRVKYRRFYDRCAGPTDGLSPACRRVPIG